jgi:hypothetical protein
MSLFTDLLSWKAQEKTTNKQEIFVLTGNTRYEQGITGEEQCQTALEAIGGPRVSRGIRRFESARLILEDKHPYHKQAVRVEVRGKRVGYLRLEHAILFRHQLMEKGTPRAVGQCQALISGGWISSDGRQGDYEVWLDLPSSYQ